MSWTDRVDSLLNDGESVEYRLEIEESTVVVTSQRVLTFTASSEGEVYRYADRPNVTGVQAGASGDTGHLLRAATPLLAGIALVIVAVTFSFESLFAGVDLEAGNDEIAGTAAVVETVETVETVLVLLDSLVLLAGLAALSFGLLFVGLYVQSRTNGLRIEVTAGDNLEIPGVELDPETVADLEAAIRPEPFE